MDEFYRIKRLPPYVFAIVNDLKSKARARGEDVIDLGMGNPDLGTPKHIVAKLVEAAQNPKNHRYSASRGITRLRKAITKWYRDRYDVELDPESEAIATIGAKEGLAHLMLAILQPGDGALVPNPTYPIHSYSVVIADGEGTRKVESQHPHPVAAHEEKTELLTAIQSLGSPLPVVRQAFTHARLSGF